jgi:hypothetical protein
MLGVFMVVSYQQQYRNRYKIRDTLNNFVFFFRRSQEGDCSAETLKRIEECEKSFFISVFIKSVNFVTAFFAYVLLTRENFNVLFFFMSFPLIVTLATCNQFFLGVLMTQYFLKVINERITKLNENAKFNGYGLLGIQSDIEKISIMHTKLFEFMKNLSKFFGPQVSFGIFNNVLMITIAGFQMFSTMLLMLVQFDENVDYTQLFLMGISNLCFMFMDLAFHIRMCVACMDEVSFWQTQRIQINSFLKPKFLNLITLFLLFLG